MEQEWTLEKSPYKNKWRIDHKKCDLEGLNFCRMPYFQSSVLMLDMYCCYVCKQKAPSHIIIQANILNGD